MEWVEGARLSDRKMLDNYGLEPSRLVDTMVSETDRQTDYDRVDARVGRTCHLAWFIHMRHSLSIFSAGAAVLGMWHFLNIYLHRSIGIAEKGCCV